MGRGSDACFCGVTGAFFAAGFLFGAVGFGAEAFGAAGFGAGVEKNDAKPLGLGLVTFGAAGLGLSLACIASHCWAFLRARADASASIR